MWFLAWYIGWRGKERIVGVEVGDCIGGVFQMFGRFPLAIFRTLPNPVYQIA
jgi:hypothetical protein